jgi:dihydrofolate synthase / folylpolyglutamate synthase
VRLPDALAWLDSHLNRELVPGGVATGGEQLGLEGIRRLCGLLGDPQDAYRVVHVTGTNGKGSVSSMVVDLLVAHGLSVGSYSSPHLVNINERIRRGGEPIDDDALAAVLSSVAGVEDSLVAGGAPPSSWFELLTATALTYFADEAVDVAVVEVGMLGRFDATNVVDADVAVVTNIGLDHTDGAGDWRVAVATEKAGIITPSSTLVLGEADPRLYGVFDSEGPARLWWVGRDFTAEAVRPAVGGIVADLRTPGATYADVAIASHGPHQADNAAMALAAVEAFFDRPTESSLVEEVFASLRLSGRAEVIGHQPLVVLDGAHNPPAAEALAATVTEAFHTTGRRILVLGMLADRDPAAFLDGLGPAGFDAVVTCTPPTPRALAASALAEVVHRRGLAVEAVDDPVEAVRRAVDVAAEDDLVVVTGSLYVVGAVAKSLGEGDAT